MPFDVKGAMASGYSLDEIGKHVGYDVEGARKSGYSNDEIAIYLANKERTNTEASKQGEIRKETPWYSTATRNLLSGLGMVVGGVVGAGAGPLGAVAGSGLGYAGMQNVSDLLDTALFGVNRNRGLAGNLQQTATDVGTGALAEVGGQVLSKILPATGGYIGGKVNKWLSPDDPAKFMKNVELGEEMGVPFTEAALTQSRPAQQIEQAFFQNPASSGGMARRAEEVLGKTEKYASGITAKFGGSKDTGEGATKAISSAKARAEMWKEVRDKAYEDAKKSPGTGHPMSIENAMTHANNQLQILSEGRLGNEAIISTLEKYAKGGTPVARGVLSDIEFAGQEAYAAKMAGKRTDAKHWLDLKTALEQDVDNFANASGNTDFLNRWDAAKTIAREGFGDIPGANIFRDDLIEHILGKMDPAQMVKGQIGYNNPMDVGKIRRAVGEEGWRDVQAEWLTNAFSLGKERAFDPEKFATLWGKLTTPLKKSMFDKETIRMLDNVASAGTVGAKSYQIAGNKSGTSQGALIHYLMGAPTAALLGGVGGYFLGDQNMGSGAVGAASLIGATLMTPRLLSRIYLNRNARAYLPAIAKVGPETESGKTLIRRMLQAVGANAASEDKNGGQ